MSLCVPRVTYGFRMFCCVTTAPLHQTFSVRLSVRFAGRSAAMPRMPRLDYSNATLAWFPASRFCLLHLVLNAAARCTSIFSMWTCYTDAPRPSLAVVSRSHRFQAGHTSLPGLVPRYLSDHIQILRVACRRFCVNGDRLDTGKWRNSTGYRIWTSKPNPTVKNLSQMVTFKRQPAVPNSDRSVRGVF